jgi:hypothetical protein
MDHLLLFKDFRLIVTMSNINALIHTGDAQETFEAQQSAYLAHQSQHAPSSSSMAARSLAEQVLADTGFQAGQSSQIISQGGHLSLTVSQIRQLDETATRRKTILLRPNKK